jgi:hypothetical protein
LCNGPSLKPSGYVITCSSQKPIKREQISSRGILNDMPNIPLISINGLGPAATHRHINVRRCSLVTRLDGMAPPVESDFLPCRLGITEPLLRGKTIRYVIRG